MEKIGVVGAGVMGSGIAHWLASKGCDVVMRDVRADLVERGLGTAKGLFSEGVKRGKITAAEADAAFGRIRGTTSLEEFAACDLAIEAIVENVEAKRKLFTELAGVVRPDALLASNTSALPIEEIAGHVPNPERTLGLHFFNPVSRMALLELVVGRQTGAREMGRALEFVKAIGKSPVVCKSSPGFLVTRVLFFYLNEAVRLREQGAPAEEIDGAMREFGWPMGPMRLIDEVGVDVTAFIFDEMEHYFPGRFAATGVCREMVKTGLLGRKGGVGKGFYEYGPGGAAVAQASFSGTGLPARAHWRTWARMPMPLMSRKPMPLMSSISNHLMSTMIAEAKRCLAEGVVRSPEDVDFALNLGIGFPQSRGGLMKFAATFCVSDGESRCGPSLSG